MCKKKCIPTSFGFCITAPQIYREILKEYRKGAITLKKRFKIGRVYAHTFGWIYSAKVGLLFPEIFF